MPRINASFLKGFTGGASQGVHGFMSGDAAYQDGFDRQAQLQTRMAQSLAAARQSDAAARLHDTQAEHEAAKTGVLNSRPDLFREQVAVSSGTDIPMVDAIRRAIAGRPDRYDMGPTTEDGASAAVPIDPQKYSAVSRSIQQFLPLLANSGDLKPDDLSKAASDYRNMGLSDAIIAGTKDRNAVGGAQAAVAGKPLFNSDSTGAVLDQYGGQLDTSNPLATSTIGLRKDQAGQARAAAADHYAGAGEKRAQTTKIQQETAQGAKGRYDPVTGMIVDERAGTARPVIGADGKPIGPRPEKLKPIPATETNRIVENAKAISNIDAALEAIKASTGIGIDPQTGQPARIQGVAPSAPDALGAWNYLPHAIRQRTDPKGVSVRAQVAQIGGQKFHDLSGAAITASEAPRLLPFIPSETDDAPTVVRKLMNLKREYQSVNDSLNQSFSEDQGYRPSPLLNSGGRATRPPLDSFGGTAGQRPPIDQFNGH